MRLDPIRFFSYENPAIRGKVLCAFMPVRHDGQSYYFYRERVIPHTWLRSVYEEMELVWLTYTILKREIRRTAIDELFFPERYEPKQAPPVRE